jgi:Ca-activated chloride channel family protein
LPFRGFSACPQLLGQDLQQPIRSINVDVDLVLVNATVIDGRNRFVQDLEKQHFRLWEDKVEQEITHFNADDSPVSLGIIFDRSGSTGSRRPKPGELISQSRNQVYECVRDTLKGDEYFLIEFSDTPELIIDFTTNPSRLTEKLVFVGAGGSTALWDAIYMGVAKLQHGTNPRKGLLVLTDGKENRSRYSLSDLKKAVRETDVRIYNFYHQEVQWDGMQSLADITGGSVFRSTNPCKELAADLRNQYVIGYRPTNRAKDGAWRDISVKLNTANLPGISNLSVRARKGYFAEESAAQPGR